MDSKYLKPATEGLSKLDQILMNSEQEIKDIKCKNKNDGEDNDSFSFKLTQISSQETKEKTEIKTPKKA